MSLARKYLLTGFLFLGANFLFSQQKKIDSLLSLIRNDNPDTLKVNHLCNLASELKNRGSFDSSLMVCITALELSTKLAYKRGIARSYGNAGNAYRELGNYSLSLENLLKTLQIAEELKNKPLIAITQSNIGIVYFYLDNQDRKSVV